MYLNNKLRCALVGCLGFSAYVNAQELEVQVVERSTPYAEESSFTLEQPVPAVGQSANNQTQLHLLPRIEQLQNEMRQLRGQLEVQTHETTKLQQQLRALYQDLDQRIRQLVSNDTQIEQNNLNALITEEDVARINQPQSNLANQPVYDENFLAQQQSYQKAYELIKTRQYDEAVSAMESYLEEYPQGQYAANAHYWLGELFILEGSPDKAVSHFDTVVLQFSNDMKVPDALLKLGFLNFNRGQISQAEQFLSRVVSEYPNSAAARLAQTRLQEIRTNT